MVQRCDHSFHYGNTSGNLLSNGYRQQWMHRKHQALKLTSYVPATMAVCFLIMIMMFKAKGGYKAESVTDAGGSSEADGNSSDEDTV